MGLGKSLILRCFLCTFWLSASCTQSKVYACNEKTHAADAPKHQQHQLFATIDHELAKLKTSFPQQPSFFITQDAMPCLYNFLMPNTQELCKIAKLSTVPHLLVTVGNSWESFNVQANACSIYIGENFLKLFLLNTTYTYCIFSIIAHELGHVFYESKQEYDKACSETLADEFSLLINPQHEALETALSLTTLAVFLFVELGTFLSQHNSFTHEEIANITINATYTIYQLIKENNYALMHQTYTNNQLLTHLFRKALKTMPALPQSTPEFFTKNLITSIKQRYSDAKFIKSLALLQANVDWATSSTHPPLSQRIKHIQSRAH